MKYRDMYELEPISLQIQHITRNMEDYVTWVDTSKIKRHVMKYNEKLDDFDLLGE